MYNSSFLPQYSTDQKTDDLYANRSFQDMGTGISGRSVVIEPERGSAERNEADRMWPYSLTDYLKNYIDSMVLAEYTSNSRCSKIRGRLKVVGIDFIGIQTCRNNSLTLLEISSIRNIEILPCEHSLRRSY